MKLRIPRRRKKQWDELTEAQQNRRRIVSRSVRLVIMVMVVISVGYGLVLWISGASFFVPRDAKGVLKQVPAASGQDYTTETIRRTTLDGQRITQSTRRLVSVDGKHNAFQVQVEGVLAENTIFSSDGNYTLRATTTQIKENQNWALVTDACNGKPSIPASTLLLPGPKQLLAAKARLATDKATVKGQRAWQLDFTLTPALAARFLQLSFLDQATAVDQSARGWVISEADRKALQAGRMKVLWAQAYVTRADPHLVQYDMRFQLQGASEYRVLVRRLANPENSLAGRNFGKARCDKQDPGPVVPGG